MVNFLLEKYFNYLFKATGFGFHAKKALNEGAQHLFKVCLKMKYEKHHKIITKFEVEIAL